MKSTTCEHEKAATARYCDSCGATLPLSVAPTVAATGPTARLDAEPLPAPMMGAAMGPQPAPALRLRQMNGGVWLIGLGVLFLTGTFWPGILVLAGISAYLEQRARGQQQYALRTLIFMLGLALLFWMTWFWPGILIVLGVVALVSPEFRRGRAGGVR